MRKTKTPLAKKKLKQIVHFHFGQNQQEMTTPEYKSKTSGKTFHRMRVKMGRSTTRVGPSERLNELNIPHVYRRRNSWRTRQHFYPGDTVWVLTYSGPRGSHIRKTTISEVMIFGYLKYGYLKDYWLKGYGNGHGTEASDIYRSYREAEFYRFY